MNGRNKLVAFGAAGALAASGSPAHAEISPEYAIGGAKAPQEQYSGGAVANSIPESPSMVGTDGVTYPGPWVDTCINSAAGVETNAQRATLNPAEFIGSGYVGKSLRRFSVQALANNVSEQCRDVVVARTIKVQQRYAGKNNMKSPVMFTSLDKVDDTKHVTLKRPFSCIKGPRSRGYQEVATMTIKVANGTEHTFKGSQVVRGKNDGC